MTKIENILLENKMAEIEKEKIIKDIKKGLSVSDSSDRSSWNLIDSCIDSIMYSKDQQSTSERFDDDRQILLLLDLFNIFPTYWVMSNVETVLRQDKVSMSVEEKVWKTIALSIQEEGPKREAVTYALWCEFFEHSEKNVVRVWQGVLDMLESEQGKRELLRVSGPVPIKAKWPLFEEMISNRENHQAIFDALVFSFADVYGKSDKKKSIDLLQKLSIDKSQENYSYLIKQLEKKKILPFL